MTQREPKDFHLARRAYEAFHNEQPQVWFENLSHDYQMMWVRVVRAIQKEARTLSIRRSVKVPSPTDDDSTTAQMLEIYASAPKQKSGRIDYQTLGNESARQRVRQAYRYLWARKLLPKK